VSETSSGRRSDEADAPVTTLLRVGGTPSGHRASEAAERLRTLRVAAAMKSVPKGIDSTSTLQEAEERMDDDGVNWLPVVERGRLVGLITRLDIRQALAGHAGSSGGSARR